jgi:hypothetical protein
MQESNKGRGPLRQDLTRSAPELSEQTRFHSFALYPYVR